jgi:predicted metal-binding membrane protein
MTVSASTFARAQRAVLFASAAAVTLTAWLWLMRMPGAAHHIHSALLPHRHGQLDFWSFVSAVAMWQAMTIAMMTPAVLPWLLTFAELTGRHGAQRTFVPVMWFAAGYMVVWLGYSVAGAALQTALQHTGFLERNGQLPAPVAGLVLIAAGLLYFTPLNRACLKHCRNPLSFILARWNNGPRGGFGMGLAHGAYCVGCCWALMATGLAMGIMNLVWMAFLTVLICVEKLAPHGDRIGAFVAVVMTIWGVRLLL